MPEPDEARQAPATPGLERLETAFGHRFADRRLLVRALVHRSYAHERAAQDDPLPHNESLEFLGDAVLSIGVSRMIYDRFAEAQVGDLARARAYLVSEKNLARTARGLGLGPHLLLGRGEDKGGGRDKDSLLADAYEAVLAAIYLDGGLTAALETIERHFGGQIVRLRAGGTTGQDYKTDLQEALQAVGLPIPRYLVAGESGPDHRKSFAVELSIGGESIAHGDGTSKKAAEQEAARLALERIDELLPRLLRAAREPSDE